MRRIRDSHRDFENLIPEIAKGSRDAISKAYVLINNEIRDISEILDEAFKIGREFKETTEETMKLIIQMKGILDEVLINFNDVDKLRFSLRKLLNFNRSFDYIITENLSTLITYAEFAEIIEKGAVPSSILDKINKIEEFTKQVNTLIKFLKMLYDKPSDIFKVEFSIRKANQMGMKWVNIWYLERETGLNGDEIREILEALTLIGVTERAERGGESVYRIRDLGED